MAYISRILAYVARTVGQKPRASDSSDAVPADGTSIRSQDADAEEAERASVWASVHGIRRFRTSHTHKTLWQLCRRNDLPLPEGSGKAAQDAARAGDYATFYKAVGDEGLRLAYQSGSTRYGEPCRKLQGIADAEGMIHEPQRRWMLQPAVDCSVQTLGMVPMATVVPKDQDSDGRQSSRLRIRPKTGAADFDWFVVRPPVGTGPPVK